jgi:hypothetical protein
MVFQLITVASCLWVWERCCLSLFVSMGLSRVKANTRP